MTRHGPSRILSFQRLKSTATNIEKAAFSLQLLSFNLIILLIDTDTFPDASNQVYGSFDTFWPVKWTARLKPCFAPFPVLCSDFPHTWSHAFWCPIPRRYFVLVPLKVLWLLALTVIGHVNKAAKFGVACSSSITPFIRALCSCSLSSLEKYI